MANTSLCKQAVAPIVTICFTAVACLYCTSDHGGAGEAALHHILRRLGHGQHQPLQTSGRALCHQSLSLLLPACTAQATMGEQERLLHNAICAVSTMANAGLAKQAVAPIVTATLMPAGLAHKRQAVMRAAAALTDGGKGGGSRGGDNGVVAEKASRTSELVHNIHELGKERQKYENAARCARGTGGWALLLHYCPELRAHGVGPGGQ